MGKHTNGIALDILGSKQVSLLVLLVAVLSIDVECDICQSFSTVKYHLLTPGIGTSVSLDTCFLSCDLLIAELLTDVKWDICQSFSTVKYYLLTPGIGTLVSLDACFCQDRRRGDLPPDQPRMIGDPIRNYRGPA